jgi:two-component SAPR family response regulator
VDDEVLILQMVVDMCRKLPELDDVQGFASSQEAQDWLQDHPVDLAILDIDMPGISGITMARKLKEKDPEAAVIFLTGYSQYAVEAFAMHASGYLLKPVSEKRLEAEVQYALGRKKTQAPFVPSAVLARTFGTFELCINGTPIAFERARSKELLALLVDRRGSMTRAEIHAVLWEDAPYDRAAQKQLDVVIRSLKKTLLNHHLDQILEMKSGTLRVVPQEFECDMYRLLAGDIEAVNAYQGEYMSSYSWASTTEGYLVRYIGS